MKKLIVTIAAIGVVAGLRFYARPRTTKDLATETVVQSEEQKLPPGCSTLGQIVENRLQSLSHFDIVHL